MIKLYRESVIIGGIISMKEYRDCKYYDKVEEINKGLFGDDSPVILPQVHVVAGIGDSSIPVSTGVNIEDVLANENPNEYLEKISIEAIDNFMDYMEHRLPVNELIRSFKL